MHIREVFEALGDYYARKHGDFDLEAGWARLQQAMDADENRPATLTESHAQVRPVLET